MRGSDAEPLLERADEGRLLAGVCAGLGERFTVDVTLLRLAAMLLALASGIGVLLYLLAWALLPPRGARATTLRQVLRGNAQGLREEFGGLRTRASEVWARGDAVTPWPWPLTRRWLAIGLMALGVFILLLSLGLYSWLNVTRVVALVLIVTGTAVLAARVPEWRR